MWILHTFAHMYESLATSAASFDRVSLTLGALSTEDRYSSDLMMLLAGPCYTKTRHLSGAVILKLPTGLVILRLTISRASPYP